MTKSVVIYLPEEFADWEGAFLLPELRQMKRPMIVVSENGAPVSSIGGLKVQVDQSISSIKPESTDALVLIGSDSWAEKDKNQKILEMAIDFHKRGILVAGICAATVALARVGLLEGKKHTSNDLDMLKKLVPTYRGEQGYQEKMAVVDGNLITATGVGPVEFTYEVMKYLKVYSEDKLHHWFALFKHGTKPPSDFWS